MSTEAVILAYMKKLCQEHGILLFKISQRYSSGFPDVILIFQGQVWFIELKRPGAVATPLQLAIGDKIKAHGGNWACLNEKVAARAFIERLVTGADRLAE